MEESPGLAAMIAELRMAWGLVDVLAEVAEAETGVRDEAIEMVGQSASIEV